MINCKLTNLFQNIDNTRKKSSTPAPSASKGSTAADPLSLIQAKTDTFDGLDPLSMFAAQEATVNTKTPSGSVSVSKKEKVGNNNNIKCEQENSLLGYLVQENSMPILWKLIVESS